MSHQTGIRGNDGLAKFFGNCNSGKTRAMKIVIENEELTLERDVGCLTTWDKDFDKTVLSMVEDDQPCFIIYRLDTKNALGYEWLFISWSPDTAAVRQKMLYASTKATLKQEFGSAHIKDDFFCNVKADATLSGFKRHLKDVSAPAPLTDREEALSALSIQDTHTDFSTESRQQTMSGVSFPMTESSKKALEDMVVGTYNYLQFRIELEEEKIHLSKSANISLSELPKLVPADAARYHLYLFKHTHEGDSLDTIVFIYSMPGYNCSIKERMLYSSCKGPFLESIQQTGLDVVKKVEIDEGSELTEEFLQEEIHPKRNLHRPAFAKPKGPPNRGAKRITKPQST